MNSAFLRRFPLVACALFLAACNKPAPAPAASPAPAGMTDEEKILYTMGFIAGGNFSRFNLNPAEFAAMQKGMEAAGLGKKPEVDPAVFQPRIDAFLQGKMASGAQVRKAADADLAVTAAKESGAVTLPSGAVYLPLKPGTGAAPKPTSTVKVHYEGKLKDGTVFDSSIKRGQPVEFALNQVIPCWTEGVSRMKVGEKARLTCPSASAYGDQGQGPIPPGATLVFDVELLSIK